MIFWSRQHEEITVNFDKAFFQNKGKEPNGRGGGGGGSVERERLYDIIGSFQCAWGSFYREIGRISMTLKQEIEQKH